MKFYTDTIEVKVHKKKGTVNLNSIIADAVKKSGFRNGIGVVRSLHTTAGIIEQEDEEGILSYDMPRLMNRLVPSRSGYRHDDFTKRMPRVGPDERKNGKAHLEHLLISRSVPFIIHDYKVELGSWPSILFIDFDPIGRKARRVQIAIIGE
mgnify:CR=1 FL=1